MLPLPQAFILLIVLFVAQGVLDLSRQQNRLADWYALRLDHYCSAFHDFLLVHVLTH